ncbi:MAG TPA: FecR domain-containing protein [Gemmatimonadaceae bacterium]|jgi:ferric-dicitrate binding protein FerR (iron transport regulator)
MLFLNLFAFTLLLGGPIAGYRFATWRKEPRRWEVVAFCVAGGLVATICLFGTLLLADLTDFPTVRMELTFIGEYLLIALVLGLAVVATPESIKTRLLLSCVTLAKHMWRRRGQVVVATVGAQLTLAVGVWLRPRLFPAPSVYVHADAPRDAERTTRLPDDTQVILSRGSHLSYSTWFSPHDERELTLDGEGTFAVARGSRTALTLDAASVEVSASNARFTVHAYNAEPVAHVVVREGLVRLRARRVEAFGKVMTLSAGEGARVGPNREIVREDSTFLLHR